MCQSQGCWISLFSHIAQTCCTDLLITILPRTSPHRVRCLHTCFPNSISERSQISVVPSPPCVILLMLKEASYTQVKSRINLVWPEEENWEAWGTMNRLKYKYFSCWNKISSPSSPTKSLSYKKTVLSPTTHRYISMLIRTVQATSFKIIQLNYNTQVVPTQ